jgi:hypothetical protein
VLSSVVGQHGLSKVLVGGELRSAFRDLHGFGQKSRLTGQYVRCCSEYEPRYETEIGVC